MKGRLIDPEALYRINHADTPLKHNTVRYYALPGLYAFHRGGHLNMITITFNDETLTVAQWAKRFGCSRQIIYNRLKTQQAEVVLYNLSISNYVGIKYEKNKLYAYNNISLTASQWAKKLGRSTHSLYYRLQHLPLEIALTPRKTPQIHISNIKKYTYGGMTLSVNAWANRYNISGATIRKLFLTNEPEVILSRLVLFWRRDSHNNLFTYNGKTMTLVELAKEQHCSIHAMRCRLLKNS